MLSSRRVTLSALMLLLAGAALIGGCPTPQVPDPNSPDPNTPAEDEIVDVHLFKFNKTTREYMLLTTRIPEADVKRDITLLCGQCHAQQVQEVKASVHHQWRARNENVLFPGGGAHGMIDRACGLPATTNLIAYTNDVQLDECGKCHVGRFQSIMEGAFVSSFTQMGLPNAEEQAARLIEGGLDCLICHSEVYRSYPDQPVAQLAKYAPADAASPTPNGYARVARDDTDFDGDGNPDMMLDMNGDGILDAPLMQDRDGDGTPETPWPTIAQDRSFEAIASIGETTDETCLRCHEHARTGYKRGTLFRAGHDVHSTSTVLAAMAGGGDRHCVACHTTNDHKFKRGDSVGGDLMATDYPIGSAANQLNCESCHPRSSLATNSYHFANHLDAMACETCHIPYAAGITYSMYGDGGQIAFGRNADGLDTKVITLDHMIADGTDADTESDWEAYKVYPTLMWFNGQVSFLAQSLSVRGTPHAKITPFKPMGNGMMFDARFFSGEMANNSAMSGAYQYNAHSMYRFFANGSNAEVFDALDMLDLTPDEVRGITLNDFFSPDANRQAMALMQIFPNLVYFEKATYGYEHYLIGSNQPWDADNDGLLDAGAPFFFDMFAAANAGLRSFQGFNGPMGLPADYEWYPPFEDASDVITMKVPDGTLIKMFLSMQGMQLPAEQQPAFFNAIANYPAFSNGITLGGHGVRPKEQALGANLTCRTCHADGGAMSHPVPVTQTTPRDIPGLGTFEFPVYRWHYYNMHRLADLGITTQDEAVAAGSANVDIAGNTDYTRASSATIAVNYINPAGEGSYRSAADAASLAGTELTADDLTWSGGEWMPVLEPDVRLVPNYEVLGYSRNEILFLD